ncbi:MAG TPA: lytic transglycosylase domain-containing protein [Bryobacteraceae bacterium]|nr:lytic transglycosylase domain-containing protein [Bryobacteraceae bacterium]
MRKLYYTAGDIQNPLNAADGSLVKWIFVAIVFAAVGWTQTIPDPESATKASMSVSLDKQRVSITKQVDSLIGRSTSPAASFYTVPWIDFPSFVLPPCDPLPSEQLDKLVGESAQREGVQPDLIRGVISQESGGRPCAISSKGAQGLMQLMPAVAAQFEVHDVFDPKQNIDGGTKLLKQLLAKYNGDLKLTLAAYNAGSGRVDSEGGVPAIPETVNYVIDVISKLPKR